MPSRKESCQIWECQPYESRTEFENFIKYYLHVPPSERGYMKAYNHFRADRGKPATNVLPGNWRMAAQGVNRMGHRVSGRYTWSDRATAYDAFQAKAKTEALHRKILEEAQQWAAEQELALERERRYAEKLYERAERMLSAPLFRRSSTVKPDGQTVVVIEPAGWRLTDIATILRLASDLNRRGLLMPRDGVQQEATWRQSLLSLDLDPDDPNTWLDFLDL